MKFELPKLKYNYDELEPYIDAKTMEIHYSKHHQGYTDNLNKILENTDVEYETIEKYLTNLDSVDESYRQGLINNGGGYYNHKIFWEIMSPDPQKAPQGELTDKIEQKFGSLKNLKETFNKTAVSRFGSGWGWLVVNTSGNLDIISTQNQENPISTGLIPILGVDVWEHAYYLKYQNKRAEYIESWWNVVNWKAVEDLYELSVS